MPIVEESQPLAVACRLVKAGKKVLIRDRRMAEAQRLLAAPGARSLAIATIAYRTGFADPAYFSRVFREATGLSPRDFRAQAAARRG